MRKATKIGMMLIAMLIASPEIGSAQNSNELEDLVNSTKELIGLFKRKSKKTANETGTDELAMVSNSATAQTRGFQIISPHPDIKMKIVRCEAASKTVVIDYVLENVGKDDLTVNIGGGFGDIRTAAYDDEGNVYNDRIFSISLGSSPVATGGYSTKNQTLPSYVPIRGRIQLEEVPESAQVIRRIDLRLGILGDRERQIKIMNIPISRDGDL